MSTVQHWPPAGFETLNFRGIPIIVKPKAKAYVMDVLNGRYDHIAMPADKKVRRVLSLGDAWGEFAAWSWKRWPNAWVDILVQDLAEMETWENLPPGTSVKCVGQDGFNFDRTVYDVIAVREARWMPFAVGCADHQIVIVDVLRWPQ